MWNQTLMKTSLVFVLGFGQGLLTSPKAVAETPVQHKLERGGQVSVHNPKGSVAIQGWDQETVEAVATRQGKVVGVDISQDSADHLVIAPSPRSASDVHLEIKVPRYAEIKSLECGEDIKVNGVAGAVRVTSTSGNLEISQVGPLNASTTSGDIRVETVSGRTLVNTSSGNIQILRAGPTEAKTTSGDVSVADTEGAVTARTNSGKITARNIGGDLFVKTISGGVSAENVKGLVNASSTSQEITVKNASGDAKAISISGDVRLECVKGRAESNTVSGSISLEGIGGDVEATTTSGDVRFNGILRPTGHYRLKSFSGEARMNLAGSVPGFTAALSTYSGDIETDFTLTVESPERQGAVNRRLVGRYGDGKTQVSLESFSGEIQLKKGNADKSEDCR